MLRRKCTCLWKHVNSTSSTISVVARLNCISSTTRSKHVFDHVKCANCAQLSARALELPARLHHSSATGRCGIRATTAVSFRRLSDTSRSRVRIGQLDSALLSSYRCRHLSSVSLPPQHLPTQNSFGFTRKVQYPCRLGLYHNHARLLSSLHSNGDGGKKGPGNGDGEEEGRAEGEAEEEAADDNASPTPQPAGPLMGALSTMTVPEIFPRVPVIAIGRNPIFPRFVKMLEVQQIIGAISAYKWKAISITIHWHCLMIVCW